MSKADKIKELNELVADKGGKCISKTYLNNRTKLKWECLKGHIWEATSSAIKGTHQRVGTWCPYCAGKIVTLEYLQELARKKDGRCLSQKYINTHTKLEWECKKGHTWISEPASVKNGHWCPICAGRVSPTIVELNNIAKERGGLCFSKKYKNIHSKLLWQCKKGHRWEAAASSIKTNKNRKGSWCPTCANKTKHTIESMHILAESRNGKCLSKKYINTSTKLEWQCEIGHRWLAKPVEIKQGKWCSYCAGKHINISDMQEIAKSRGGECLSQSYQTAHTKLKWKCAIGHEFSSAPNSIKNGQWCPSCSSGLGERIVRTYLEQMFKVGFPNTKPNWLISSKGTLLEIDGYNDGLKLGFEHQGRQHYELNYFTPTQESLDKRILYDKEKEALCIQNDVRLLIVPELFHDIQIEELKVFLLTKLNNFNIQPLIDIESFEPDLTRAYSYNYLKDCQELAKTKNGKCLSTYYWSANKPLLWECEVGHQWKAIVPSIKRGSWCPKCAGKIITIEEVQEIAKERAGKCLSKQYVNSKQKLLWQCSFGHQWNATIPNIKRGTWCPECSGNTKSSISELIALAKAKKGQCLSTEYIRTHAKIKWKCDKGHVWEASPSKIKMGRWCPTCSGNVRQTIGLMREIAKSRNGICLSNEYINSKIKLEWQCELGHVWMAQPVKIKGGTWCPVCSKHRKKTDSKL